ncbi:MAG: hypothetical protein MUO76_24490 [Anaerolineaceae bacterium]|nr:hypothetical protein [Anaerolineaceae bacterium]
MKTILNSLSSFIRNNLILVVLLAAAAAWKTVLLGMNVFSFNSDEAIVALMAKHILSGERPIFFYGQSYMGSLDAFLVAGGFLIFGQHVWVIRLIQSILYLLTIITTVWIAKVFFNSYRSGIIAAAILAVPTVNILLYTTISLGGYGEALLLGNLILLSVFGILRNSKAFSGRLLYIIEPFHWISLLLGILMGIGLWANGITLVYSIPSVIMIIWIFLESRKQIGYRRMALSLGSIIFGFIIAAFPYWIYGFQEGWQILLSELLGSAVSVEKISYIQKILLHAANMFLMSPPLIFGFRPPWGIRWLMLPLIPFVNFLWFWILWVYIQKLIKKNRKRVPNLLLFGVICTLTAGFVCTSFGSDPSGRYFLPLGVLLAIIAAEAIQEITHSTKIQICLITLLIVYQLFSTIQVASENPPGLTTQFDPIAILDHTYDQELIDFLTAEDEIYGYTNYWTAYPLAFLSDEELIFIPRLPYHLDFRYTSRDDRYEPYRILVESAKKVAYITTNHPELDNYLRESFAINGITWSEKEIGDYNVFFRISRVIRPEEMGFGE